MKDDKLKDKLNDKASNKAMKALKKTRLTTIQAADILKIVTLGVKNGLTGEQIAKEIDDKYYKKELEETKTYADKLIEADSIDVEFP